MLKAPEKKGYQITFRGLQFSDDEAAKQATRGIALLIGTKLHQDVAGYAILNEKERRTVEVKTYDTAAEIISKILDSAPKEEPAEPETVLVLEMLESEPESLMDLELDLDRVDFLSTPGLESERPDPKFD